MNRVFWTVLLLAACPPPFVCGQLSISVETGQAIAGCVNPKIAGTLIFLDSSSKPRIADVALLNLDQNELTGFVVTMFATNEKLQAVPVEQVSPFQYAISTPGRTSVFVQAINFTEQRVLSQTVLVELGEGPNPPPGPDPGPDPEPEPDKDVIPSDGFRVLFIRETADLLPQEQQDIIASPIIRNYLNSKCVKDSGQPGWRFVDPDSSNELLPRVLGEFLDRPRDSVPWVVISDGQTKSYEGPWPANVTEMLDLLKGFENQCP